MLRVVGDKAVRSRVELALRTGEACWCPVVRLELWNGAGGPQEKKVLRELERLLPELPVTPQVWDHAYELARKARAAGFSASATDLLIVACARVHGADLEYADSDFDRLEEFFQ